TEQFGESGPEPADEGFHRFLAVGGAEDVRSLFGEIGELFGTHLGGAAPEPAVGGLEFFGQSQLSGFGHVSSLPRGVQRVNGVSHLSDMGCHPAASTPPGTGAVGSYGVRVKTKVARSRKWGRPSESLPTVRVSPA